MLVDQWSPGQFPSKEAYLPGAVSCIRPQDDAVANKLFIFVNTRQQLTISDLIYFIVSVQLFVMLLQ